MSDTGDSSRDVDEIEPEGSAGGEEGPEDPALEIPALEDPALEAGQLAYDCAAWAGESRRMLASLLGSNSIEHAWQGTMLTVHDADEERVDELIDDVLAASRPALDPSAPKLVYEVGSWPASLQTELAQALTAEDISYEWDEHGDLVVLETDEEAVAAVLDELPDPDDAAVSSDDGVAVHELLDGVFMAADRLSRNGSDARGTVALVETAEVLGRLALPFGFEPAQWRRLVAEVTALSDAIEPNVTSEPGEPLADATDEDIAAQATAVREQLRQYI